MYGRRSPRCLMDLLKNASPILLAVGAHGVLWIYLRLAKGLGAQAVFGISWALHGLFAPTKFPGVLGPTFGAEGEGACAR